MLFFLPYFQFYIPCRSNKILTNGGIIYFTIYFYVVWHCYPFCEPRWTLRSTISTPALFGPCPAWRAALHTPLPPTHPSVTPPQIPNPTQQIINSTRNQTSNLIIRYVAIHWACVCGISCRAGQCGKNQVNPLWEKKKKTTTTKHTHTHNF